MSFSDFANDLGCPLKNVRQSWSAISPNGQRAIFTVWADKLIDGRCVMEPSNHQAYMDRFGGKELHKILLRSLADHNIETLGIRCEAKNPNSDPRSRKNYDKHHLLALSITRQPEGIVAEVIGQIPTQIAIDGLNTLPLQPVPYAIDDLQLPPNGNPTPDRIEGRTFGYLRDLKVRSAVLKRANGHCEYCKETGFLKANGERYIEAHHIIALADSGPDTMSNVIALCANHHREAHFGKNAEALEKKFISILTNFNLPSPANP